jgi:hypothetical protein
VSGNDFNQLTEDCIIYHKRLKRLYKVNGPTYKGFSISALDKNYHGPFVILDVPKMDLLLNFKITPACKVLYGRKGL